MRTTSRVIGCMGVLLTTVLAAADPPYFGRWKVNVEKSDYGTAFTFARDEAGALRLTEGDRSYVVRFDGKEYPHPLGGAVWWTQLDARSWEIKLTQNRTIVADEVYRLSNDGRTITVRPSSGRGSMRVYRRTSGDSHSLIGTWTLQGASDSTLELAAAEGYELVIRQGSATLKANFDGRDHHPTAGPETVRIARVGADGFSMTVSIDGKMVAFDTFTVSADGESLTQVGGSSAQSPTHSIVYERQH